MKLKIDTIRFKPEFIDVSKYTIYGAIKKAMGYESLQAAQELYNKLTSQW